MSSSSSPRAAGLIASATGFMSAADTVCRFASLRVAQSVFFFRRNGAKKLGRGPWQNANNALFSPLFFFRPKVLRRPWQGHTLVGYTTFPAHRRQSKVPLQVGACTNNRVLIRAAALLSESADPRQKATVAASWLHFTCSGTKPKWVSAETPVLSCLFLANMAAVKNVYWEASGSAVCSAD